jgi:hypothetical protein
MALSITPERYAAIRARIERRRTEALVAEITATDWNDQPNFQNVDDFLNFADTFIEQSEADPPGSRKRR